MPWQVRTCLTFLLDASLLHSQTVPSRLSIAERIDCANSNALARAPVRPNQTAGRVVALPGANFPWPERLRRLLDVGRVPGRALLIRPIPVADVFAGTVRRFTARVVRTETFRVARLAAVFSGPFDSLGAGRFSIHVLLLPRRVLQS